MYYLTEHIIAHDWAARCFGEQHVKDKPTRALRVAEEAIELAQSLDISREQMIDLVNNVYKRPRGVLDQELGGVLITTYILCLSAGLIPELVFRNEIRRVLNKDPNEMAKRNLEKMVACTDGTYGKGI